VSSGIDRKTRRGGAGGVRGLMWHTESCGKEGDVMGRVCGEKSGGRD
jgi:hypothetical protein